MTKILGIDYGAKRVGLAIADADSKTAVPYKILENTGQKNLISELHEIIKKENVSEVVLGMPLSMSNNGIREEDLENEHMKKYLDFKDLLEEKLEAKIIAEDERLSTKMARGLGSRNSKEKCDDVAAMLILQSYLDRPASQNS